MESLEALNDPFLAKREQAEFEWDNRFKDVELDCPSCLGTGWFELNTWLKCSKCQGGSIYTALCIRCQKDDNHCECSVGDFL